MFHFYINQTPDINIGFLPLKDNGSDIFHIQNEDINPNCNFVKQFKVTLAGFSVICVLPVQNRQAMVYIPNI